MSPPLLRIDSDEVLPRAVDVVVVGAGISGICTAWELARQGVRVAVLEKGVVAGEQSSRNWGWCRQQNRHAREIALAQIAVRMWEQLPSLTGEDVGFRRTGLLYTTNDPADMERWHAWAAMAAQHRVESRVLTGAQVAGLLPSSPLKWLGGVHSPTDGTAEPAIAVPTIARAARRLGVTIHQNCAARELEMSAGRVSGVVTEKGSVRCAAVLLAGGAWTGMMMRHHGLKFLQACIEATAFSTASVEGADIGGASLGAIAYRRRLDGGYTIGSAGYGRMALSPWSLLQAKPFWKTFLKRRGRLAFGLDRTFFTGPEAMRNWKGDQVSPFERTRILDPQPLDALVQQSRTKLAEVFPHLRNVGIVHRWGGAMDFTPDGLPVMGPVLSHPGLFISAGHSGHGFGIGPAAGRLMAELIRNDTPCVDPRPFRYERMIDGTDLDAMGMM